MTDKIQSKTWRQWDDEVWCNAYNRLFLVVTSCRENDVIKYAVLLTDTATAYYNKSLAVREFNEMPEALDFIKEFITDD